MEVILHIIDLSQLDALSDNEISLSASRQKKSV